jgi:protein ImuB
LLDSLLFVIGAILDRLLTLAKAHMLALASVSITLSLVGRATHSRTVRPALPTIDKQVWIKLLHLELEEHPPRAAIHGIALRAEPGSTGKLQLGMFSPQLPEPTRLDITLARIRAMVGEGNVGRAVLKDTHEPDAFRVEPFTTSSNEPDAADSPQQLSALRQIRPPEAVLVTVHDSRPASFFFRERNYRVERAYGPWIAEGNWWCETLWGSEQWDLIARAQDNSLLCCCIMRDLMNGRWQIVSLYD